MGKQRWPQYGSQRYRRQRASILQGNPLCFWGCGRPATTADHEPPLDVTGAWHWDLVPACSTCNFGRRNRSQQQSVDGSPSRAW